MKIKFELASLPLLLHCHLVLSKLCVQNAKQLDFSPLLKKDIDNKSSPYKHFISWAPAKSSVFTRVVVTL